MMSDRIGPELDEMHATLTERTMESARRSAESADSAARDVTTLCLLDWLGCAIGGANDELVDKLVEDSLADGGPGDAPLIGRRERLSLRNAVLVNGAAGHALDYDDGLHSMGGHPSAPIAPALVGLATRLHAPGRKLVTAYILAVDVAARIGLLLSPDHYQRGFHGTATAGAIGAAAGCAYLLDLNSAERANAIGLAATRAAGLRASFGSEAKPLHAGWAALVGLTSAQWASRGFTGAPDIAGHAAGLRSLSADFHLDQAVAPHPPHILDVTFKYHAACAGTHAALEALREIVRHREISPLDIASVAVTVDRRLDTVCNRQQVASGPEAKFSLRMVAAMLLAGVDTAATESFADEVVNRSDVRAIFDRVAVSLDDRSIVFSSDVSIVTASGANLSASGTPAALVGEERRRALEAKFVALASPRLGAASSGDLLSSIIEADQCSDVALITALSSAQPLGASGVPA
jgi:2-methylcitrate dehydratase PrpD